MVDLVNALAIAEKVDEYLRIPSVVTCERPFLDYLQKDFASLGIEVEDFGDYLVVSSDWDSKLVLSAHTDRHGLVALPGPNYGYMAFVDDPDRVDEHGGLLKNVADNFVNEAVFAYDAITGKSFGEGVVANAEFSAELNQLVFQIDGLGDLPQGTPVAFARLCDHLEKNIYSGQTDNVVSVALIYHLFSNGFKGTALLTTQEEIGNSWRQVVEYNNESSLLGKSLLVIDTSPYPEKADIPNDIVVLRRCDRYSSFDKEIFAKLIDLCDREDIPYNIKDDFLKQWAADNGSDVNYGSTELGHLIQETAGEITGTTVQIPTFCCYHSNHETTSLESIEYVYELLLKFAQKV